MIKPLEQVSRCTTQLVVLISGSGTNLQAIMDNIHNGTIPNTTISAVISNRPHAGGLARAAQQGITTEILDHTDYDDRESYDSALLALIKQYDPDFIILAGFMRILSPHFIRSLLGKIINIHPSLLPQHKGLNTHASVLSSGDTRHGCSVHYVTEDLDSGPVIGQASFDVPSHLNKNEPDPIKSPRHESNQANKSNCSGAASILVETQRVETQIELLRARVQQLEHILYPRCLQWLVQGQLRWDLDNNQLYFNNKAMAPSGIMLTQ